MEMEIQSKLRMFARNAQIIIRRFVWQNAQAGRMAAFQYAKDDLPVDIEKIQQCLELIKKNTRLFSTFRGNMALCLAALLSLSPDPDKLFDDTLKVYAMMKDEKFSTSDYLVIAAYEIAAQSDPKRFGDVVARTRDFYDGMKSNRFFQMGQDDYIYTAMLGLSDLNVTAGVERIEEMYRKLEREFKDKNSIKALAQLLVLGGSDDVTVENVFALHKMMRSQKIKMSRAYNLTTFGMLALLPVDIDIIVSNIKEVKRELRMQRGFSASSITTQEVLLYAAATIANYYIRGLSSGALSATVSTSIVNIIVAQQAAMIATIATASVRATSLK